MFVVLLGALLLFSAPPGGGNQSANPPEVLLSALEADERFFDFGTVSMARGKVTKNYTIKNSTDSAVVVKKLYTSCMCTQASLVRGEKRVGPFGMPGHSGSIPTINQELKAGEEAVVEVVFDPAAHGPAGVGPVAREVYVETLDGGKLTLSFKANVTP